MYVSKSNNSNPISNMSFRVVFFIKKIVENLQTLVLHLYKDHRKENDDNSYTNAIIKRTKKMCQCVNRESPKNRKLRKTKFENTQKHTKSRNKWSFKKQFIYVFVIDLDKKNLNGAFLCLSEKQHFLYLLILLNPCCILYDQVVIIDL